ncbi:MAG: L,D-transpeptidase family protein [Cyanobacteria bacterium P01_D01_bin.50]
MLIRISLLSLICLTVIGCQVNEQRKESNNSLTQSLSTEKSQKSVESDSKSLQSSTIKDDKHIEQKIATGTINPLNNTGSFMTLTPTGQTNALNNPIYTLRLYANGELVDSFLTVSGRTHTQNRNRHQSGTEAPLPDGKYMVAKSTIPGAIAEAGELFLPIEPRFKTGRSALGFHVDPSFNKDNGEDGTAGCIGLIAREDLDKLLSFVGNYQPQFLDVKIQYNNYASETIN